MADILQGGKRDTLNDEAFVVTNYTEDYSFDANGNNDLITADVLATLIRQLIRRGIINGTVA